LSSLWGRGYFPGMIIFGVQKEWGVLPYFPNVMSVLHVRPSAYISCIILFYFLFFVGSKSTPEPWRRRPSRGSFN